MSFRPALAVFCFLSVAACSKPPSGPCDDGEHVIGAACVPDVFDSAVIPPQRPGTDVDRAADGTLYLRGELLVFLRDDGASADDAAQLVARYGGQLLGAVPFGAMALAEFPDATTEAALEQKRQAIAADPAVAFAVRDAVAPPSALSGATRPKNDFEKLAAGQADSDYYSGASGTLPDDFRWPFDRIGAADAWNAIYDANLPLAPVTIAVIDGHVERAPLFQGLAFDQAYDLRLLGNYSADAMNPKHGTAVAAIIGAPNDGMGTNGIVAGVSTQGGSCVQYDLAPIAVAAQWSQDAKDAGIPNDAVFFALVLAVKNGARVVNVSLAGDYTGFEDARAAMARSVRLIAARAKKALFVLGAGNDDRDAGLYWPASAARQDEAVKGPANLVTVAAIDKNDHQAVWSATQASNYDLHGSGAVSLSAPGSEIVTQLPSGALTLFQGTSAAAPMVSGSAALLFAVDPKLTGAEASDLLLIHGDVVNGAFPGGPSQTIRLDAGRAVSQLLQRVADDAVGSGQDAPFGKGSCRQEAPPADVCRVLLDPNAADPLKAATYFEYALAIKGSAGSFPLDGGGKLHLIAGCGPATFPPPGFTLYIAAAGNNAKDDIGDASCDNHVLPSAGDACGLGDADYAPGASYSMATPFPNTSSKVSCEVRCPADPMATQGTFASVTGGELTVTFADDCRSVTGSWHATTGVCNYDVAFTGSFTAAQ